MSAMASQITSLTIVYSTVYSGADQRKHQSSASLAFVRGIHRLPVNSLHKGPVTWEIFPFDDVFMNLHVTLHNAINVNIRSGQLNTMFHSRVHFQILTPLTYSQHILQGHVRGLQFGECPKHTAIDKQIVISLWLYNAFQKVPTWTHMVRA